MYADSADAQSRRLRAEALKPLADGGDCIHVLNTNLWPRTDAVTLGDGTDLTGKRLLDASGRGVATQRLHDGRWIFLAERVPALSSAVYRIVPDKGRGGKPAPVPSLAAGNNTLDNGLIRVEIDPADGTIRTLKTAGDDFNYAAGKGLNAYLYTCLLYTSPSPRDCS